MGGSACSANASAAEPKYAKCPLGSIFLDARTRLLGLIANSDYKTPNVPQTVTEFTLPDRIFGY